MNAPECKAWCVDDGEEKAEDCIGYSDPIKVAQEVARDRWKRAGEPWEQTVRVRKDDVVFEVVVETVIEPRFKMTKFARVG